MRRRDLLIEGSRIVLGLSTPVVAACALRNRPSAPPTGEAQALIVDLERHIPELMRDALVPGLSIAVVKDGGLLWRRGFGVTNSASKHPVDDDTVFEAASTSKPVFAYAVMKLCERGLLDLDAPLTRYALNRLLADEPRLDLITARRVLSHTTGLPNIRSRRRPLALYSTPGDTWSYSGEGYAYLQSVVTHVVGGSENTEDCSTFETDMKLCATVPSIADYMTAQLPCAI